MSGAILPKTEGILVSLVPAFPNFEEQFLIDMEASVIP